MDNLEFLRALDNDCIDLIAIDPPFAANETFTGRPKPPITDAEKGEERALAARHDALARYEKEIEESGSNTTVKDQWFFRKVEQDWMDELGEAGERVRLYREWEANEARIQAGEHLEPTGKPETPTARDRTLDAMREVIEAVTACATENEAAYIALMSVRLYECRRVLKDTGSIYVHCDWHANSYLRMLMDAIFGAGNFRNEIAWERIRGAGKTSQYEAKRFGNSSDRILFYGKSASSPFYAAAVASPYDDLESAFPHSDEKGRYKRRSPFRPPGLGPRPNLCYEYKGVFPPHPSGWTVKREKLERLDEDGELEWMDTGKVYRKQRVGIGIVPNDIWGDIDPLTPSEHTGYATQKPLILYRRIIRASSSPGDVVLDLFAGCATTAVAAELEDRQWLACDMAYRASTMMMRRFYQNDRILSGMNVDVVRDALGPHTGALRYKHGIIIGPPDLPSYPRTTTDPDDGVPDLKAPRRAPIRKRWRSPISEGDSKDILIARWGPICWGCNYNATRPNGTVNLTQLELDHIQARKAKDGVPGGDELYNLALLCAYCNRKKGAVLTLAELRKENAKDNALYVDHIRDLVPHEYEAREFAVDKMVEHAQQAGMR